LDALDSVQAQSYPDWECIVVNDTGKRWAEDIMGAPFARVINMDGNQGAARARNEGLKHARGSFIIWLDADDYWLPWYLDRMIAHAEINPGVIFCDLIQDKGDKLELYRYPEFVSERVPAGMRYPGSSILIPRYIADKVVENQGGWDTQIPGMEDWDYQTAIHDAGFCAYHVDEALFVYRVYSSTKRERDYAKIDKITAYMDEKWKQYRKDGKIMGCGCGSIKPAKSKPASTLKSSGNFSNTEQFTGAASTDQLVMVEYLGPQTGKFTVRSRVLPGKSYRFGNNPHNKIQTVFLRDAEALVSKITRDGPEFRIVTGGKMEQMDPGAVLGRPVAG
jgi:glycosyltransferase involved in cell wall biosynthesis